MNREVKFLRDMRSSVVKRETRLVQFCVFIKMFVIKYEYIEPFRIENEYQKYRLVESINWWHPLNWIFTIVLLFYTAIVGAYNALKDVDFKSVIEPLYGDELKVKTSLVSDVYEEKGVQVGHVIRLNRDGYQLMLDSYQIKLNCKEGTYRLATRQEVIENIESITSTSLRNGSYFSAMGAMKARYRLPENIFEFGDKIYMEVSENLSNK